MTPAGSLSLPYNPPGSPFPRKEEAWISKRPRGAEPLRPSASDRDAHSTQSLLQVSGKSIPELGPPGLTRRLCFPFGCIWDAHAPSPHVGDQVFKGKARAFDPVTQPVRSQQGGRLTSVTVHDDTLLSPRTKLGLRGRSLSVAFPHHSHLFSGNSLSLGELYLKGERILF